MIFAGGDRDGGYRGGRGGGFGGKNLIFNLKLYFFLVSNEAGNGPWRSVPCNFLYSQSFIEHFVRCEIILVPFFIFSNVLKVG